MAVERKAEPARWSGPPKCRYCGGPLDPHQAVRGFCDSDPCGSAHMRELVEDASLRRRREQEDLLAIAVEKAADELERAAAALSIPRDALTIGVVPHQSRPLTPLPSDRREDFVERLETLIAEAFGEEIDDPGGSKAAMERARAAHEPDERPEYAAGCAVCRGSCCNLGGSTHAFLSADDFRRYRLRHPDATPESALADYLDRLPARSGRDSCVYHGEAGCVLPRRMRADICNEFHCHGLVELGKALGDRRETGAPTAYVAQTMGAIRGVGAFDRAGGLRPVPLSPENAAAAEEE